MGVYYIVVARRVVLSDCCGGRIANVGVVEFVQWFIVFVGYLVMYLNYFIPLRLFSYLRDLTGGRM